jgi:hypothetical protein
VRTRIAVRLKYAPRSPLVLIRMLARVHLTHKHVLNLCFHACACVLNLCVFRVCVRACACVRACVRACMQGKMCDQSALEPYKLGGGKQVTAVYEYWSKKRSRLGKALIRRMQAPTPLSDMSPHNTFRPREKEEKKFRRTRKNDKDAHKKLKALQIDFKRCWLCALPCRCTRMFVIVCRCCECGGKYHYGWSILYHLVSNVSFLTLN